MSEASKATMLLLLSVIYLLSPLDFVPDALPVAGNLDDLVAVYFGMGRYLRYKHSL